MLMAPYIQSVREPPSGGWVKWAETYGWHVPKSRLARVVAKGLDQANAEGGDDTAGEAEKDGGKDQEPELGIKERLDDLLGLELVVGNAGVVCADML